MLTKITPHELTSLRNFAALAHTHNVPFKIERKVVAKILDALDVFFAPAEDATPGQGVDTLLQFCSRIEKQEASDGTDS